CFILYVLKCSNDKIYRKRGRKCRYWRGFLLVLLYKVLLHTQNIRIKTVNTRFANNKGMVAIKDRILSIFEVIITHFNLSKIVRCNAFCYYHSLNLIPFYLKISFGFVPLAISLFFYKHRFS
ncbi:MAG: hypothetical protein LBO06_00725, partial [Bacteroidales bacterium]|nr:hypothetical protein [Bacteroidales bacterium]